MNCRLCQRTATLCNSHIIPEFFYRHLYDDKHRLIGISEKSGAPDLFRQKGIYERLLCLECEKKINHYEKHVKRAFYDHMEYYEFEGNNRIKIVGLDYDRFKLFQLSLLWRAGVSSDPFFDQVQLGPYEQKIRTLLLEGNPGRYFDFGCTIIGLTLEPGQSFDVIWPPESGRVDGHRCFRFVLGGCVWTFLVSRNTELFGRKLYFLQPDGTQIIPFYPANKVPFILSKVSRLQRAGKLNSGEL